MLMRTMHCMLRHSPKHASLVAPRRAQTRLTRGCSPSTSAHPGYACSLSLLCCITVSEGGLCLQGNELTDRFLHSLLELSVQHCLASGEQEEQRYPGTQPRLNFMVVDAYVRLLATLVTGEQPELTSTLVRDYSLASSTGMALSLTTSHECLHPSWMLGYEACVGSAFLAPPASQPPLQLQVTAYVLFTLATASAESQLKESV